MRSPRPVVDFPLARRAMAGAEPGIGGGSCNVYMSIYNIRERGREGSIFFPECVAKASRFTLGVWGLGRGRSTPLSHPQPLFVTVRNRSQPSAMRSLWPCLWEVLQKWSLLEVTNFSQRRFSGTL